MPETSGGEQSAEMAIIPEPCTHHVYLTANSHTNGKVHFQMSVFCTSARMTKTQVEENALARSNLKIAAELEAVHTYKTIP